jgi:DNA-binding NarL/FixJ family response regulator
MIRILVVDDQKSVHQALKSYLEVEPDLEIVGFAANGHEAIKQVEELNPDLVLMDIEMPGTNGLEATKIISERFLSSKVLMLTSYDDEQYLNCALQMGAKGYLLKTTPARELVMAIRYAYKGYFQLGPDLIEKYVSKIPRLQADSHENDRLREALKLQIQTPEKIKKEIKKILAQENRVSVAQYTNLQIKIDNLSHLTRKLEKQTASLYKFFFINVFLIILIIVGTLYTFTQTL